MARVDGPVTNSPPLRDDEFRLHRSSGAELAGRNIWELLRDYDRKETADDATDQTVQRP